MAGPYTATTYGAMSRSHKVDIGGLLAGSRQTMLLEDDVPIESFEGIAFRSRLQSI